MTHLCARWRDAEKPVERPARVACSECLGKGMIALWPPGQPRMASMARCEQCSGFGKVRAA